MQKKNSSDADSSKDPWTSEGFGSSSIDSENNSVLEGKEQPISQEGLISVGQSEKSNNISDKETTFSEENTTEGVDTEKDSSVTDKTFHADLPSLKADFNPDTNDLSKEDDGLETKDKNDFSKISNPNFGIERNINFSKFQRLLDTKTVLQVLGLIITLETFRLFLALLTKL